jgi:hypothetical protein
LCWEWILGLASLANSLDSNCASNSFKIKLPTLFTSTQGRRIAKTYGSFNSGIGSFNSKAPILIYYPSGKKFLYTIIKESEYFGNKIGIGIKSRPVYYECSLILGKNLYGLITTQIPFYRPKKDGRKRAIWGNSNNKNAQMVRPIRNGRVPE